MRGGGNLNENLAREVMELHTTSPAAGYSQKDIIEAALILTGWQWYSGKATHPVPQPGDPYGPYFQQPRHEPSERKVMGRTYKPVQFGKNQAAELLADLAIHPQTAKFLSKKLLRHFLADDPPEKSIQAVEESWHSSGGDLFAIHTAVIDQVIQFGVKGQKFTTPQNWLIQTLRLTGVEVPKSKPYPGTGQYWINGLFEELGQSYNKCPQPNGYSDLRADWISKEMLDRRLRFSFAVGNKLNGEATEKLRMFATLLAGNGSTASDLVARAETVTEAATLLLCSPDFLTT